MLYKMHTFYFVILLFLVIMLFFVLTFSFVCDMLNMLRNCWFLSIFCRIVQPRFPWFVKFHMVS